MHNEVFFDNEKIAKTCTWNKVWSERCAEVWRLCLRGRLPTCWLRPRRQPQKQGNLSFACICFYLLAFVLFACICFYLLAFVFICLHLFFFCVRICLHLFFFCLHLFFLIPACLPALTRPPAALTRVQTSWSRQLRCVFPDSKKGTSELVKKKHCLKAPELGALFMCVFIRFLCMCVIWVSLHVLTCWNCMCSHGLLNVSSWFDACVLMICCMCPHWDCMCSHGLRNVSSWFTTCVLVICCMCPHFQCMCVNIICMCPYGLLHVPSLRLHVFPWIAECVLVVCCMCPHGCCMCLHFQCMCVNIICMCPHGLLRVSCIICAYRYQDPYRGPGALFKEVRKTSSAHRRWKGDGGGRWWRRGRSWR